jgi:hypothetical protein
MIKADSHQIKGWKKFMNSLNLDFYSSSFNEIISQVNRSFSQYGEVAKLDGDIRHVVYFKSEAHKTWFILRWS